MKYKAIIFDLDGVICHTDKYHYEAWKEIANKLNVPFDESINNRLRGISRLESLNIILEQYNGTLSADEKENYANDKNAIYRKLLDRMDETDLTPNVMNTLMSLRSKQIKLAIGSSSRNAQYILEKIGLGNFFDAVSDGNNIVRSKPDPEVFIKASQYLNVKPEECLVIEDAVAGIEAAKSAHMDSALIGDAVHYNLATYSLMDFADILKIIE